MTTRYLSIRPKDGEWLGGGVTLEGAMPGDAVYLYANSAVLATAAVEPGGRAQFFNEDLVLPLSPLRWTNLYVAVVSEAPPGSLVLTFRQRPSCRAFPAAFSVPVRVIAQRGLPEDIRTRVVTVPAGINNILEVSYGSISLRYRLKAERQPPPARIAAPDGVPSSPAWLATPGGAARLAGAAQPAAIPVGPLDVASAGPPADAGPVSAGPEESGPADTGPPEVFPGRGECPAATHVFPLRGRNYWLGGAVWAHGAQPGDEARLSSRGATLAGGRVAPGGSVRFFEEPCAFPVGLVEHIQVEVVSPLAGIVLTWPHSGDELPTVDPYTLTVRRCDWSPESAWVAEYCRSRHPKGGNNELVFTQGHVVMRFTQ